MNAKSASRGALVASESSAGRGWQTALRALKHLEKCLLLTIN
jgi:hypothetical protein